MTKASANLTGSGTSFYGTIVKSSISKLTAILGKPQYMYSDIEDKTQNEWVLEHKDTIITLYDWKEYRNYTKNEIIEFHIGGNSQTETDEAGTEIQEQLDIYSLLNSLYLN